MNRNKWISQIIEKPEVEKEKEDKTTSSILTGMHLGIDPASDLGNYQEDRNRASEALRGQIGSFLNNRQRERDAQLSTQLAGSSSAANQLYGAPELTPEPTPEEIPERDSFIIYRERLNNGEGCMIRCETCEEIVETIEDSINWHLCDHLRRNVVVQNCLDVVRYVFDRALGDEYELVSPTHKLYQLARVWKICLDEGYISRSLNDSINEDTSYNEILKNVLNGTGEIVREQFSGLGVIRKTRRQRFVEFNKMLSNLALGAVAVYIAHLGLSGASKDAPFPLQVTMGVLGIMGSMCWLGYNHDAISKMITGACDSVEKAYKYMKRNNTPIISALPWVLSLAAMISLWVYFKK